MAPYIFNMNKYQRKSANTHRWLRVNILPIFKYAQNLFYLGQNIEMRILFIFIFSKIFCRVINDGKISCHGDVSISVAKNFDANGYNFEFAECCIQSTGQCSGSVTRSHSQQLDRTLIWTSCSSSRLR